MTASLTKSLPLVSIIIDNYNYGQYLTEAVDSALAQTYAALEVIVVDDGSTDHSAEIIRAYGDRVIPVLKTNGGQASTFNAGFAQSRGDIVIFLDSDDALLPNIVQAVVEVLRSNPAIAKLMYRMEVIDAMGTRTGTIKPARHLPLLSGDLRQHVLSFPFDMTWTATSGNAFAASVLRQILPMPEQDYGRVGADWYLSHLAPLFGPIYFLDEIGAYYRVHGSNSHEVSALDLTQIRQSMQYMCTTSAYIQQYANRLGLRSQAETVQTNWSVSYVASRMVSLKLDPQHHPVGHDKVRRLFSYGVAASLKRFDVSWPMKAMYVFWFAMMSLAPKGLARQLAEKFFFPQARPRLNRLLGMFHGLH